MNRLAVLLFSAALIALPSHAAEIALEQSAVQQLVAQSLFRANGRMPLQGGPCNAFLERPAVTLTGGRLVLRSRLVARVGVAAGDQCVGATLVSWTTVSGRPRAREGVIRLDDVRIDSVDDPTVRIIVNSGLVPQLPRTFEISVVDALQRMFSDARAPVETTVTELTVHEVSTDAGLMTIRFDFKLSVK